MLNLKGETTTKLFQSVSKLSTRNSAESLINNEEIRQISYVPPFDSYREPSFFLRLPIFRTRKTITMTKTAMTTTVMTPIIRAAMFNESLSSVLFSDESGSSM